MENAAGICVACTHGNNQNSRTWIMVYGEHKQRHIIYHESRLLENYWYALERVQLPVEALRRMAIVRQERNRHILLVGGKEEATHGKMVCR